MTDTFELYRLSLLPRKQASILTPDAEKSFTREEYLRQIFMISHKFNHFGNELHYVPAKNEPSSEALLGRIGRTFSTNENLPPDEGLADAVHQGWRAVVIVIDPRHHADGQKVAVERTSKVGDPQGLLNSLIKAINLSNPDSPYLIEASAIFDSRSFWEFAENNQGAITSLTFEFITPNMFGGIDDISEELKKYRNIEKAQNVTISMCSQDGLDVTTQRVKASVDYAQKGGGNIKARARKNKRYNSTKKAKKVTIQKDSEEPLLKRATRKILEILGRE